MEAQGARLDGAFGQVAAFLPLELRRELAALPAARLAELEEIRLRPDLPVLLRFGRDEALLAAGGGLLAADQAGQARVLGREELARLQMLLTGASWYAWEGELRRGYLTLPGGHRAGVTGQAVLEQGRIRTLKDVSSINLRLARPIPGCANGLLPCLLDEAGRPLSALLVSPPRCGKTTLLRELARLLSDGVGAAPCRVGIADERSELAALREGVPQLPVGLRSDVLDGAPKAEAMELLLRSMSPDVLVCDELGRAEDAAAVQDAAAAGVAVIASAHGRNQAELTARPVLQELLQAGLFQRLVFLSRRCGPGTVEQVMSREGMAWRVWPEQ